MSDEKYFLGKPVKVHTLCNKVVEGLYNGISGKFIILLDAILDGEKHSILAVHKNQVKYYYRTIKMTKTKTVEYNDLNDLFNFKKVQVILLKRGVAEGVYNGIKDQFVYLMHAKVYTNEGLCETPAFAVHKNQIVFIYTIDHDKQRSE